MACSRKHCCNVNETMLTICIFVDRQVDINNTKLFSFAKGIQQFALLSNLKNISHCCQK